MLCSTKDCKASVYCRGMCKRCYQRQYMRTYDNKWKKLTQYRRCARRHGITPEEYEMMFEGQEGRCAICGKPQARRLNIDHDHATGKIRGLLCSRCNLGLGYFKDNIDNLNAAVAYLGG